MAFHFVIGGEPEEEDNESKKFKKGCCLSLSRFKIYLNDGLHNGKEKVQT